MKFLLFYIFFKSDKQNYYSQKVFDYIFKLKYIIKNDLYKFKKNKILLKSIKLKIIQNFLKLKLLLTLNLE